MACGIGNQPIAANSIYGLLLLDVRCAFDFMAVYTASEREQIRFWNALLEGAFHGGALYMFTVLRAFALPDVAPLVQFHDRHVRGCTCTLEEGQPAQLWAMLPPQARALQDGPPTLAVRLPPQFALLMVHRFWNSVCIPHVPRVHRGGRGGGSSSFSLDAVALGVVLPAIPAPIDLPEHPALTSESALQIADALRTLATHIRRDGDEFGEVEYNDVAALVGIMHATYEQLDPLSFLKTIKDLRSAASLANLTESSLQRSKFNVVWLLRVMLLSDCLRTSAELKSVLKQALQMCVPAVLLQTLTRMVDDHSCIAPTAGTVSRWRLLLDGAYMLFKRSKADEACTGPGTARYLMSDSSTQHGRSFQLTTVLSVSRSALPDALEMSSDLANLWQNM